MSKQEQEDYKIAYSIEESDRNILETQKNILKEQLKNDKIISIKLDVAEMRAEHRKQKYLEMEMEGSTEHSPGKLWLKADPVVDNVRNGICITILLPNIKCLNVKLNDNKMVTVEAERQLEINEESGTYYHY